MNKKVGKALGKNFKLRKEHLSVRIFCNMSIIKSHITETLHTKY